MKKIVSIIVVLLATITLDAQDGRSIYNKYSDYDNVSAVYISPSMFKIMGKLPEMNLSGDNFDFSSVIKSLNGFYLIDSRNASINAKLRADAEKSIDSGKFELLMEAKDKGETVRIYTLGDEIIVTGLVMIAYKEEECTYISLDGKISRDQLELIISKQD